MINSRYRLFSETIICSIRKGLHVIWYALFQSYGINLQSSLTRVISNALVHLYHPTCVGLRYGQLLNSLRGFSRKYGINCFVSLVDSRHHLSELMWSGFSSTTSYRLEPGQPSPGLPILLRPPFAQTLNNRYRNINLFSIVYAIRPRLRSRLTLGGLTFPRNPWDSGEQVFHLFYRY